MSWKKRERIIKAQDIQKFNEKNKDKGFSVRYSIRILFILLFPLFIFILQLCNTQLKIMFHGLFPCFLFSSSFPSVFSLVKKRTKRRETEGNMGRVSGTRLLASDYIRYGLLSTSSTNIEELFHSYILWTFLRFDILF